MISITSARWRHEHRRGLRRAALVGGVVVTLATAGTAVAATTGGFGSAKVGQDSSAGILLPTNQRITPLGQRLLIDNGRLLASSISPNGRYLAASTWNTFTGFLTVIDLSTDKIVQQIGTGVGTDAVIGDGTVAADGPLWSSDGTRLWFPQSSDLVRFSVAASGTVSDPVVTTLETTVGNLTTGMTTVPDLRREWCCRRTVRSCT